jgi:hypothetical protein
MLKKKRRTKVRGVAATRERLNVLLEAVALIIARRQMRHHWTTAQRATLTSAI